MFSSERANVQISDQELAGAMAAYMPQEEVPAEAPAAEETPAEEEVPAEEPAEEGSEE